MAVSRRCALRAGLVWLALSGCAMAQTRPSWTTSRIAGTPDPPPPYRVEPAFPKLHFVKPLDLVPAPGSPRLFVAELDGKIYSFVNDPQCSQADLVIDLKLTRPDVTAIYGIAFHPDFQRNGRVFVCFVEGNDKPDGTWLCEYRMSAGEPPTLDAASERVLMRWWSGGHNGGCLKFGPDGYFYVSAGDGGATMHPDPFLAGQDVSSILSTIMRIDVDHYDAEKAYSVPLDNPFVDVAGARPEIWAYGFRNPWRMSFDRESGDFWVGDVGWQLWEMVYQVQRGGNYGWAVMEGPQPTLPEIPRGPTPILPPVISHPHSESSSVTGGYVYRGQRLPELRGAYIYGDFQTGTVWGLRSEHRQITWNQVLARTPLQLVSFGEDLAGELYLLDYERSQQIYRLAKNEVDASQQAAFPRLLSQTGLFSSVSEQSHAPGVLAYAINAAHWADHTTSQRWMAIPGAEPIQVDADDQWQLPDGSVLAKTVSIELEAGRPNTSVRLETQILHLEQGAWRPYTYIWNDEQTDAELADAAGVTRQLSLQDAQAPGGVRQQDYRFASRAECQLCHNPWVANRTTLYGVQSASPLAVSTRQLNRASPGATENQLTAWRQTGWLAGNIPSDPSLAPAYPDPYDATADLDQRARTYLQVNCAHCHQPNAGGATNIDFRFITPLEKAQVLSVRPAQGTFGITDVNIIHPGDPLGSVLYYRLATIGAGHMPRLGSQDVDQRALAMVYDWIAELPSATPALEHVTAEQISLLLSSTRGALSLVTQLDRGQLSNEMRQQVIALGTQHAQAEIRDLFERFVPASQRTKRLGSVVDAERLLALPADAARGRALFFREGAAACKSCHRIQGVGETVGPDLSEIGKKYPPPELLTHLLEPSKLIEPKYLAYMLETADGRVLSGMLVEQNKDVVVLRSAQNQEIRVPASEVEALAPQQKSLMPELLLRDLTPQQAADLIAFLGSLK